jgi:hypothetical protein
MSMVGDVGAPPVKVSSTPIVLFWPSLLAYWTVRLFRLGRPPVGAPPT